jgi:sugar phosphate isomerase/epimerase
MRAYLFAFFSTVVGLLLVPFALYPQFNGTKIAAGRAVRARFERKFAIADKLHAPKIVILAGSNAMFGFSAAHLEEALHRPAVNMAVHAGLGLDYILHVGRKVVRPGDLVILPLEYELYGDAKAGYARDFQVLTADQQYLREMPLIQQWAFLIGISPREWWEVMKSKRHPQYEDLGAEAPELNDNGDEVNNEPDTRDNARVAYLAGSPPSHYRVSRTALRHIIAFADDLKSRGARVVFTYPNILDSSLDERMNREFFSDIQATLKKHGVELLGTPSSFAFDQRYVLDTIYHQTSVGQRISTDKLIALLRAQGIVSKEAIPASL